MKNIFFTVLSFFIAFSANAQLINDGASIIVEDGATLYIEGSLQNNLTGSIDIQGTGIVEVEGDVTIAPTSTVTMSNTAKVILSGPNASNVTSGGATFTNVEMDKTSNNVSLLDQMRISQDLNFVGNNNKIILGDNNLVFAPSATITSADANEYIVADGDANTGVVSKEVSADEVFVFEIGDATNYTPLDADITGTGYSSAMVDVNVVAMDQPNKPAEATDFISRYWNVDQSGITDFSADLEGTYVAGDVTGTAADIKGAHFGTDWTYDGAAAGTNSVIGTIAESGDFTGTNAFGKIDMKVFLQGPYAGGSMSTALNASLIPLISPYDATVSVGAIPADVTDWISVELRDATTPATLLSTSSAFLKNDGSIVGLDGTSLPLLANPVGGTGHIVIKHRNHLPIRTSTPYDLTGNSLYDFSTGLAQAYDDTSITLNDAMIDLGSGVYGMFRANVNSDNFINILDAVLTRINSNPSQVGVYSPYDVNLDGNVNILDSALARLQSNPTKSAHQ